MMRSPLLASVLALLPALAARAACPPAEAVERPALRMVENRRGEPLCGMESLADGRCAQDKPVALLPKQFGRPAGYKIGLANPAAQRRFGAPHPVAGTIHEATLRLRGGAEVPARFAAVPAVEADLLVRVRAEGINAARTHEEILRHLDRVIPFIELPDLVMPPAKFDGPNMAAMDLGARLGVSGEPIPARAAPEFAAALGAMAVADDTGEELARAPGAVLLGHPPDVLPRLAEDLAKRGKKLQPGDFVSLGSLSPRPLSVGVQVR